MPRRPVTVCPSSTSVRPRRLCERQRRSLWFNGTPSSFDHTAARTENVDQRFTQSFPPSFVTLLPLRFKRKSSVLKHLPPRLHNERLV